MRVASLVMATAALLFLGALVAYGEERPATVMNVPYVSTAADQATVTPVQWRVYRPVPRYGYYYGYPSYYYYPSPVYTYPTPRYDYYYGQPYNGYYTPGGVGVEIYGPRRTFRFEY